MYLHTTLKNSVQAQLKFARTDLERADEGHGHGHRPLLLQLLVCAGQIDDQPPDQPCGQSRTLVEET